MTNRPINLPRIRRALNELDRIAAEHPEITGHHGQWDESEVDSIMRAPPKPARERVADFRRRMIDAGHSRISFYATTETKQTLDDIKARTGATTDAIIAKALQQLNDGSDHAA